MPKLESFRPVILGSDITAYSLARTFHEAYGVTPIVVNATTSGPFHGSRIHQHVLVPGLDQSPERLIGALRQVGHDYATVAGSQLMVIGSSDWYVQALIRAKDELAEWFIVPYINAGLYDQLVLKDRFYARLKELDIPHPRTVVYNCQTRELPEFDFGWPIVAKPASSALYHDVTFPGKKKVFILNSRSELDELLTNLATSTYDDSFLIQEFIPGEDSQMRVLTCYSDQDAKVRFAALGHVLLEQHSPQLIGNPAAIITEEDDALVHQATRLLEHLGYTGFSNFDAKLDPRDGVIKFFEINARLGRSNYYVTGAGDNVATWMVRDRILGEPMAGLHIQRNEHLFTFLPKIVIREFVHDDALRARALRLMATGRWSHPLIYAPDMSLRRRAFIAASAVQHWRSFRRYAVPKEQGHAHRRPD